MINSNLEVAKAVVMASAVMTAGVVGLTIRTLSSAQDHQPTAVEATVPASQKTEKEKEPFTAWGKEINGLQAGLGYRAGEKRAYARDETVRVVVRIRNVGKDAVTFRYCKETYFETPPMVTDAGGKLVELKSRRATGFAALLKVTLEPGKEIEIGEVQLEPRTATENAHDGPWYLYTTGKFTVRYDQLETAENDRTLSKLATGKLELEVKDAEKEPKGAEERDQAAFTAWGKEVDGLQAGLSILDRNNIKIGAKATAVAKLRNVSKEAITVSLWLEDGPHVVDALGKPVHATMSPVASFHVGQLTITVDAGQTVQLPKTEIFVLAVGAEVPSGPEVELNQQTIYVPPGTYKAGFKGFSKDHPDLMTGTVEFKVKDERKLTVDQAKNLLPEAAGIRYADFKALSQKRRLENVNSKSLSLVLLALKPPPHENPDADEEFRILGEDLNVSNILDAMWISKDKGYGSFIQPEYITDCTCESTAERADGVVTFKSDLFAGRIPFVAQATKDGWVITEFRLPQYKTKVVRGKDGVWEQQKL